MRYLHETRPFRVARQDNYTHSRDFGRRFRGPMTDFGHAGVGMVGREAPIGDASKGALAWSQCFWSMITRLCDAG